MSRHDFPTTPGDRFPTPPRTIEDRAGREIAMRAVDGDGAGEDPADDDPADQDPAGEDPADDDPTDQDPAGEDPADDDPPGENPAAHESAREERDEGEGSSPGEQSTREAVAAMYEAFDPADRAQGVPPAGPDRVRAWLDDLLAEGINVVAWYGDDVVGHAVLMPDGDLGWELAIFVHQPYQSAGIGTELLRTLLGLGRERGAERVWLTVERWNRPAIALYESVGFDPSDAERFEMGMSMRLD